MPDETPTTYKITLVLLPTNATRARGNIRHESGRNDVAIIKINILQEKMLEKNPPAATYFAETQCNCPFPFHQR